MKSVSGESCKVCWNDIGHPLRKMDGNIEYLSYHKSYSLLWMNMINQVTRQFSNVKVNIKKQYESR